MGEFLREEHIQPAMVLCSSSRRTQETLERLGSFGKKGMVPEIDPALYAADAGDMLERLRRLPEKASAVMVIAHNPGIHELALTLAGSGEQLLRLREGFPTGALATLAIRHPRWSELRAGGADLVSMVAPRDRLNRPSRKEVS